MADSIKELRERIDAAREAYLRSEGLAAGDALAAYHTELAMAWPTISQALAAPSAREAEDARLSDERILALLATAADEMDATRVHEMVEGKWLATTIFTGDTAPLRFARMVEKAALEAAQSGGEG